MALTILNEQYPPRKPKLTLTADSLDELPTEGVAEGSTATVGGTEYSYDSNAGWIEPGSGGGSGGGVFVVTFTQDQTSGAVSADKTPEEIEEAAATHFVFGREVTNSVFLAYSFIGVYKKGDNIAAIFNRVTFEKGDLLGTAKEYTINKDKSVTVDEWAWTVEDDS